jgi:hypothetical protein
MNNRLNINIRNGQQVMGSEVKDVKIDEIFG